jgi:hypothetical protein
LIDQDATILDNIPIQVLSPLELWHQLFGKCGLTDLAWSSHDHHLSMEIFKDEVIEIAFHATIL